MSSQEGPVAGWDEFIRQLADLPQRMLAQLPEPRRQDPQLQQEVARLAVASLAHGALAALGSDGDAPQFLPSLNQTLNIGQPNADTIYRSAAITPGGCYRITGSHGTLALAVIAQVIPRTPGKEPPRRHLNLAELSVDADGRFEVMVSPERPARYDGDWWELDPGAAMLMLRMVSCDWEHEVDPTLAIERLDRPAGRPRPDAATLQQRLRQLPATVDRMALMFVGHFERLYGEGYVNRLKVLDLEFGTLAGQFYYEGAYELADDEALIIESPVPTKCDYRSIILTNELYETIDWYNNHSSLNGAQSAPDADGKLRVVVSTRDPGVKNWLDTAGHSRGVIQGRWTGCDSHPVPTVHRVKTDEVMAAMPAGVATVTPAERDQIIRKRRAALLQRPLW